MQTRSDRNRLCSSISRVYTLNVCRDAWAWDTRRWQQGSEATVIINPWLIWVEAITTSHVALVPSEGGHTHPPDSAHTPIWISFSTFWLFRRRQKTFDEVFAPSLKQKQRERGTRSEIHHYVVPNIVFQANPKAVASRQPVRVNTVCYRVIYVACFPCECTIILCTFPNYSECRGGRARCNMLAKPVGSTCYLQGSKLMHRDQEDLSVSLWENRRKWTIQYIQNIPALKNKALSICYVSWVLIW